MKHGQHTYITFTKSLLDAQHQLSSFYFHLFFVIANAHVDISHNMPHTRNSPHTRDSAAKPQISLPLVRFCCVALDQFIAHNITKLGIANLLCVTGGVFQWVSLQLFGYYLLR